MSPPADEAVDVSGRVSVEFSGALATITLDRDGKRNAMTAKMWDSLRDLATEVGSRGDVAALAIRGAHQTFSAGADLAEVYQASQSPESSQAYCRSVVAALMSIGATPVPTVAMISGVASGGGAEIAVSCDLRLGTADSVFHLPLNQIGVVPDQFTFERLNAITRSSVAQWLLYTGTRIDSEQAYSLGILDFLLNEDDQTTFVAEFADQCSRGSRYAIGETKKMFQRRATRGEELEVLMEGMVRSFTHGDVGRSARAFLQMRSG